MVSAVSRQKVVHKMTEVSKDAVVVAEKRGVKIHQTNPSIPSEREIKRNKRAQIGTDMRGLVVDSGSGEILGHGGAIAYEWEEVDKERFVKLYLAGLKQAASSVRVRVHLPMSKKAPVKGPHGRFHPRLRVAL